MYMYVCMYVCIHVCSFFLNIYILAYFQYVCACMYVCICMHAVFMQTFQVEVCVLYIPIRAGNLMSGLRQECVRHFPKVLSYRWISAYLFSARVNSSACRRISYSSSSGG